jgi:hypothetical protein
MSFRDSAEGLGGTTAVVATVSGPAFKRGLAVRVIAVHVDLNRPPIALDIADRDDVSRGGELGLTTRAAAVPAVTFSH